MEAKYPFTTNLALRESERVLMHILRREGALSKAELARLSGMSAQGVAVIMDGLLRHNLVLKGAKQRGRVGQPSTPLLLNSKGAFSLGIHVATDGIMLCLVDFLGEALEIKRIPKDPADKIVPQHQILEAVGKILTAIPEQLRTQIVGVGIAAPQELMDQCAEPDPRHRGFGRSTERTLQREIEERVGLSVHCVNDIHAACIAESTTGVMHEPMDFLYIYIGRLLGAGLVLEGKPIGTECSVSSNLHLMPIPLPSMNAETEAQVRRLGSIASLVPLDNALKACGRSLADIFEGNFADASVAECFDTWRDNQVIALSQAISCAFATVPLERIVIDAGLPRSQMSDLVSAIDSKVRAGAPDGVILPEVVLGSFGDQGKAIGAAILPIQREFLPEILPSYAFAGRRAA